MKSFKQHLKEHNLSRDQIQNIDKDVPNDGIASPEAHRISDKVFGEKQHTIVVPLPQDNRDIEPHPDVSRHLESKGYRITDYVGGYAQHKDKKQPEKIGKIIADSKTVSDAYRDDADRTEAVNLRKPLQMVISRHPHQVAGMSTGYNFKSCMELPGGHRDAQGGCFHHLIPGEVMAGTHVAYLTHAGDDAATKPLARIAMRPFTNPETGNSILKPEEVNYGAEHAPFKKAVNDFAEKHFPAKEDVYHMASGVYDNDAKTKTIVNSEKILGDKASSPDKLISVLKGDADIPTKLKTIQHPNANENVLFTAASDGSNPELHTAIMNHPKVDSDVVSLIAGKTHSPAMQIAAIHHPKANDYTLYNAAMNIKDPEVHRAILNHPLINTNALRYIATNTRSPAIHQEVMNHPLATADTLDTIANATTNKDTHMAIINHPKVKGDVLRSVAQNTYSPDVHKAILRHPKTDEDVLHQIARNSEDEDVLKGVVNHRKTSNKTLQDISNTAPFGGAVYKAAAAKRNSLIN